MQKIKLTHRRLKFAAYVARMRQIHSSLNGNASFPALAPKLPPFLAAIDAAAAKSEAYELTMQLAATQLTARNDAADVVEERARGLASGSEGETLDDTALLSGGWHLRPAPVTVGKLPAPDNVHGSVGSLEGTVDFWWQPVPGRHAYIGEYATDPAGPWTQCYVGKPANTTVAKLTPGQLYSFRTRATGKAGPGPWSNLASARAK